MLEPHQKLAALSRQKQQDCLREAAEIHRAAKVGGWGLRWHAARVLLALAGRLSPAHQVLLNRSPISQS